MTYQYIALKDVLKLLGKDFHIYEQPAVISTSKSFEPQKNFLDNKRIYAQHITNLDIEEIEYHKGLFFVMHIFTKTKETYSIFDDNVSFHDEVLKVSANPYISPMFVMKDKQKWSDNTKLDEMIKLNEKFIKWLLQAGVSRDALEKKIVQMEARGNYVYNLPNIRLDYVTGEFSSYIDGKLSFNSDDIEKIIGCIKDTELKTKLKYLLTNIGTNTIQDTREVYNYD